MRDEPVGRTETRRGLLDLRCENGIERMLLWREQPERRSRHVWGQDGLEGEIVKPRENPKEKVLFNLYFCFYRAVYG